MKDNFEIDDRLPQDEHYRLAVLFAQCRQRQDFRPMRKFLADDVTLVLYGYKVIHGAEDIVNYWIDKEKRNRADGVNIRSKVRLCNYHGHAAVYDEVTGYKNMFVLFRIADGIISHVLYTPQVLQDPSIRGIDIDCLPFAYEYIIACSRKRIEPQEKRLFCMRCGAISHQLQWHSVHVANGKMHGRIEYGGYATVCPRCRKVVEFFPDIMFELDDQDSTESKQSALPERIVQSTDKEDRNLVAQAKQVLQQLNDADSNRYGVAGMKFHRLLDGMASNSMSDDFTDDLRSHLNDLTFTGPVRMHRASSAHDAHGDVSWFYVNDDASQGGFLNIDYMSNHTRATQSPMAAWQAYLMLTTTHVLPFFWHGEYQRRQYIFAKSDLNRLTSFYGESLFANYDLSNILEGHEILPSVEVNRNTAIVSCCFWNDWTGLVRESVRFVFHDDRTFDADYGKATIIYSYDCGIFL